MKKPVFVSYTTPDKEKADALVAFLESKRIGCFIAPRDVDPGRPYAANLMKAIDECSIVILVASDAINSSEHVLNEVDAIVGKKKDILPVFIEDFVLSDDYRYYLGRKQWIIAYPEEFSVYFSKILEAMLPYLPEETLAPAKKEEPAERAAACTTVFEYQPERGIMINPEDHQRNVSFRTDTFINLMGGIYEKVDQLLDAETAHKIFYDSGYVSGRNFAERMSNVWDTGFSAADIRDKFDKWCRFDSAVGWGHFSADIRIDEKNDSVSGTIAISEAFIVDHAKKRKICGFIKGYCTGVAEQLLGSEVELTCIECPLQSRFKCRCVFDVKFKN